MEIKLSPSAYDRWSVCPGSAKLIADANVPFTSTIYSAEGNVGHIFVENGIKSDFSDYGDDRLGEKIEYEGFEIEITEEFLNSVRTMLDYVKHKKSPTRKIISEEKLSAEKAEIPGIKNGIIDVQIVDLVNQEIEIADYKHGKGVTVDALENGQMRIYLLMTLIKIYGLSDIKSLSELENHYKNWIFKNTIVQPRAYHPKGRIRSEHITSEEFFDWVNNVLKPQAKACFEEDAKLVPSGKGCQFCPIQPCSAQELEFEKLAILDFKDFGDDDNSPKLSAAKKTEILDNIDWVRSFLSSVEKDVKIEIDSGSVEYDNKYKLIRTRKQRTFLDDAFDPITSPLFDHIDEKDVYKNSPKGIGEIESLVKNSLKAKGVKNIIKKSKSIVSSVCTSPNDTPISELTLEDLKLVPWSNSEKAVPSSLERDFLED